MKRIISVLLAAVLLLTAVPITAGAAKDTAVEQKFRLLLDDYDFQPDCDGNLPLRQRDHYYELAQYPQTDPDWVLFSGGATYDAWDADTESMCATLGNKLVYVDKAGAPFKLNYGVYDTKSGLFYDLLDAWNMDFENLRDVWNALPPTGYGLGGVYASPRFLTFLIGDADEDGEVTILDATHIQRGIADLGDIEAMETIDLAKRPLLRGTKIRCSADFDRDGDITILDATRIQRDIADLPSELDYRLAWDQRFFPSSGYDEDFEKNYIIDNLDMLDLSDSRFARDADFGAEQMIRDAYDDSYFRENSLLLLDISLTSGSYHLTLSDLAIDRDGVLDVSFTYLEPNAVTCDMNDRFVCIEITKTLADAIRSVKVNITPIRGKNYDYYLSWDKSDSLYTGNTIHSELITDYRQLDPANPYHKALLDRLDPNPDNSFRYYASLLANVPLGSTSYTIEDVILAIDGDGILHIQLIAKGPQIGNAVANTRFVRVELSKDWLSECKGWQTDLTFDYTASDVNYRTAKLTSYNITNPGMKEIYLYNSLADLKPANKSHQMLIDKYGASFFEEYSLVAINYELPQSTLYQFSDFTVVGSVLKARILETKTGEDSGGSKHVWYVFEIKKAFIKGVTDVQIDRVVTEQTAENYKASDLTKAEALPTKIPGSSYQTLTFFALSADSFSSTYEDTGAEKYVGSKWYELKEQDPGLNGIVGVANDPNQLLSLWYDLPDPDGAAWQYERYPSRCPYDLNFFRFYSVIAIVHRDDYSGKSLWIDNLYLKDGKLIVSATLGQTSALVPRETYYVTLVAVNRQQLEGCSDIEVYGKQLTAEEA